MKNPSHGRLWSFYRKVCVYRGQAPGKGASLESNSQPDFDRDLKRTSTIALGNNLFQMNHLK